MRSMGTKLVAQCAMSKVRRALCFGTGQLVRAWYGLFQQREPAAKGPATQVKFAARVAGPSGRACAAAAASTVEPATGVAGLWTSCRPGASFAALRAGGGGATGGPQMPAGCRAASFSGAPVPCGTQPCKPTVSNQTCIKDWRNARGVASASTSASGCLPICCPPSDSSLILGQQAARNTT